jgi:hypothetical protein
MCGANPEEKVKEQGRALKIQPEQQTRQNDKGEGQRPTAIFLTAQAAENALLNKSFLNS